MSKNSGYHSFPSSRKKRTKNAEKIRKQRMKKFNTEFVINLNECRCVGIHSATQSVSRWRLKLNKKYLFVYSVYMYSY